MITLNIQGKIYLTGSYIIIYLLANHNASFLYDNCILFPLFWTVCTKKTALLSANKKCFDVYYQYCNMTSRYSKTIKVGF